MQSFKNLPRICHPFCRANSMVRHLTLHCGYFDSFCSLRYAEKTRSRNWMCFHCSVWKTNHSSRKKAMINCKLSNIQINARAHYCVALRCSEYVPACAVTQNIRFTTFCVRDVIRCCLLSMLLYKFVPSAVIWPSFFFSTLLCQVDR